MVGLHYIFERPVAERIAPWLILSNIIFAVVCGTLYLAGEYETGHYVGGALMATDALVIVSVLARYYTGTLR